MYLSFGTWEGPPISGLFLFMDVNHNESAVPCFRLSEADMFLPSFHAMYGYKNKFCAQDIVHAAEAVLEGIVS